MLFFTVGKLNLLFFIWLSNLFHWWIISKAKLPVFLVVLWWAFVIALKFFVMARVGSIMFDMAEGSSFSLN